MIHGILARRHVLRKKIESGQWTVPDLARFTGVSQRTVFRDLNWLKRVGVNVVASAGRGGGVRILNRDKHTPFCTACGGTGICK